MIKIIICDDQTVVREGLAAIIGSDAEIQIIDTAENGADVIAKIKQNKPDIVLMDLNMPVM
ncbi:MAG: response regulator, partial [bacterium]|nr:response regulator [bacterium]